MGIIYICPSASIDVGMNESRDLNKFLVRMPPGMREHIASLAKENGRSMNAEIVYRLQTTIEMDAYVPKENTHPEHPARTELRELSEMIARATDLLQRMERKGE